MGPSGPQLRGDAGAFRAIDSVDERARNNLLFERYGVPMPANPWPGKVAHYASLKAACEASVQGEIENEHLYQRLLASARRHDIRTVFEKLREASQLRHLPAFRRCAARYSGS